MDERSMRYAEGLARLLRCETVSAVDDRNLEKFYRFHEILRGEFPLLFARADCEVFDGSLLLRWKGCGKREPIMLMNHHDVVEAGGTWSHGPFDGDIAEGKLWGRGTVDTKGGLYCMMRAAEELIAEGFEPAGDVYFFSTCNEETTGEGAERIAAALRERGIHFLFTLDEGGMILTEPIAGAKGCFALIGLGEKGCADLKFIARSTGGHASTPGKNTPLVRLGKFMAAAEKADLFPTYISPVVHEMFARLSGSMSGAMKLALGHSRTLAPLLEKIIPSVSPIAGAMLRTTLAFTMAQGSGGNNVLPQEAWVVGNMRFSHHQGGPGSIEAVRKLAARYDIETEVLDPGNESPLGSTESVGFRLAEKAVSAVFPDVKTAPYLMTGATDSRYLDLSLTDCALRFSPFLISDEQLSRIHGIDENIDITALPGAVDFYRYIMKEA